MLRRIVPLVVLAAFVAALPSTIAAATVDGVLVYRGPPINAVTIVAPLPDHNVTMIDKDAATGNLRITVNGKTTELSGLFTVDYYGGAGGSDQLTVAGVGMDHAWMFGDHNRVTVSGGGTVYPNLYGDYDSIDATGGHAYYNVYDGAHNTYAGTTTLLNKYTTCVQTTIPGVFYAGTDLVLEAYVVSPRSHGNTVTITSNSTTHRLTVTENGASVTLAQTVLSINYWGSWNGGDSVTMPGGIVTVYGSQNHVQLGGAPSVIWILGDSNTVSTTRAAMSPTSAVRTRASPAAR